MRTFIDCRYLRERPSGIGTYVEALVDRLPQLAPFDLFHLWAHRLARQPLSPEPNVFETRILPEPNSLWPILWPERYADLADIDLFHSAHNILPRNLPCPSVVTIHDLLPLEHPELSFVRWTQRAKRIYYVRAQWRALQQATRLIVTTEAMAGRVEGLVPGAHRRVAVVPLGVDARFRPALDRTVAARRAAELTASEAPYLLVVGQHAPNKRHWLALTAFAQHVPKPWRLVLVQRQTRRCPLEKMAHRLGVGDRVAWFPHLDMPDLLSLYQAADALLQPSIYEGFGLPLVEAMACGCPVVAINIPTLREVVGNAGFLASAADPDAFGRAVGAIMKSPAWRSDLRDAGIERARGYSWDRCAQATLDVFRAAAGAVSVENIPAHESAEFVAV